MRWYGRGGRAVSTKKFSIVCDCGWRFIYNDPQRVAKMADDILRSMGFAV